MIVPNLFYDGTCASACCSLDIRCPVKIARARLLEDGIEVGPIEAGAFRETRRFSFSGPGNVCITILESFVS